MRTWVLIFMMGFIFMTPSWADVAKDGEYKEYYGEDTISNISHYKMGKLHGAVEEYYENGTLKALLNYENGHQHGLQVTYYENGAKEYEWDMINGENHGTAAFYYDNGRVWDERIFKNGQLMAADGTPYQGVYTVFYSGDKQLFSEDFYKDGRKEGLSKVYHENGQLMMERPFQHGKLDGSVSVYSPEGKLYSQTGYVDGVIEGMEVYYFENGHVAVENPYKGGELNGVSKVHHEQGGLYGEYSYVNGLQSGVSREYDEGGSLLSEWHSENDHMHGEAFSYYPNGNVKYKAIFDKGQKVGPDQYYYEDGTPKGAEFVLDPEQNRGRYGVLWFIAFLMAITFHEAGHAFAAHKMGDDTAYQGGQVTLNPIPHIQREPLGTVAIPIISYITGGWMFGWASAPYSVSWAQRYPKRSALMAAAGPAANLALLLASVVLIRIGITQKIFLEPSSLNFSTIVAASQSGPVVYFAAFLSIVFSLNLILFVFNLLPLPPLDGSGIVPLFLNDRLGQQYQSFVVHGRFALIGIYAAWHFFDVVFNPIFLFSVNLLFPGANYGA